MPLLIHICEYLDDDLTGAFVFKGGNSAKLFAYSNSQILEVISCTAFWHIKSRSGVPLLIPICEYSGDDDLG